MRLRERRLHDGRELGVGQEHLRFAVVEAERDRRGVLPVVERVEDGTERRHRVVRLEHRRHVRRHDGDGVAAAHAASRERGREPAAARLELAIGERKAAVPDRDLVGPHERAALEEHDGRERDAIGGVRLEIADERMVGGERRIGGVHRIAHPAAHRVRAVRAAPVRLRISRCCSRFHSRSLIVARLSYCFLPLARPTSSLTRPGCSGG